MGPLATADICDKYQAQLANGEIRILPPIFQIYGQRRTFFGPIATVKVYEDNVFVREFVESRGEGRVLFIDGGGNMKTALIGGRLTGSAESMGWAGIVVNGCIRDVEEVNDCDIGVRALASNPRKPGKERIGEKHKPIIVAGTVIHDGEWLYADSDGILISKTKLSF